VTPPPESTSPAPAPAVIADVPDRHRYVATVDEQEAGYLSYEQSGTVRDLQHTVVDQEFGGRGIGSDLIRYAIADIRSRGDQLIPTCSFVKRYLERHPDDAELVAP
jgi:predicted GNAT family acetyltransferase